MEIKENQINYQAVYFHALRSKFEDVLQENYQGPKMVSAAVSEDAIN